VNGEGGAVRSTAGGVFSLFVGNFTSSLLLAACAIFVGRYLGTSDYGLYSIALILPGYLYLFLQLGIPSAATRFAAKYRSEGDTKKAESFVYSLVVFQSCLALISLAVVLPFDAFIGSSILSRPDVTPLLPLAAVSILGNVLYYTGTGGFQGLGRMDRSAQLQVFQALVKLAASVGLLLFGFGVFGAVAGNTISLIMSGLATMVLLVALKERSFPREMWKHVRTALGYSAPLYIATIVAGLLTPYGNTLLAHFVSNDYVGYYSAAINLSALVNLFIYPISTTLFPLFSGLSEDRGKQADVLQKTVKFSALVVVPVTAVIMALCTPIAGALYGRGYNSAGIFLAGAVAPNLLAGFGSVALGSFLTGIGRTREFVKAVLVGAVISLAAATVLTPFWGVFGVITANILAQVIDVVLFRRVISRAVGRSLPTISVWKVYPSSLGAGLVAFAVSLLPLHPIILTLGGGVAFLLVLVPLLALSHAMSDQDVSSLQSYFSSIKPLALLLDILIRYYRIFRKSG
jgi:O-antigen/teichoic acid export membrane protein